MSEDKIYIGSGKTDKFNDVNIALCLTKIPKEWIYEYNGEKYVNISCKKKREVDQHGKSHYIQINTFKPEQQNTSTPEPEEIKNEQGDDDLPF